VVNAGPLFYLTIVILSSNLKEKTSPLWCMWFCNSSLFLCERLLLFF